jgi:hypothetical protein
MKDIEPILAEYLYDMSKMGKARTKPETFELAYDVILDTSHDENFIDFIKARDLDIDVENLLGEGWYWGFLKRNEDVVRSNAWFKMTNVEHGVP